MSSSIRCKAKLRPIRFPVLSSSMYIFSMFFFGLSIPFFIFIWLNSVFLPPDYGYTTLFILFTFWALFVLTVFLNAHNARYRNRISGLPNYHALATCRKPVSNYAAVSIKVIGLDLIKDRYGTQHVSEALVSFSRRLTGSIPGNHMTFHLFQKEYVIFLSGLPDKALESFIWHLSEKLTINWHIDGDVFPLFPSFGVDLSSQSNWAAKPAPPLERYRRASTSPYHTSPVYTSGSYSSNGRCTPLEYKNDKIILQELINLFYGGKSSLSLSLNYQPIVLIQDPHTIEGVELLLRANHPMFGAVSPLRIVHICEKNGLGEHLGAWIFDLAATDISYILLNTSYNGKFSFNINPSLMNLSLPAILGKLLDTSGLPPERLCLEITEDNFDLNFDSVNLLIAKLKKLGITVALDDFGTGYSSLQYLCTLRIDTVKIDKSFIDNINSNTDISFTFLQSLIGCIKNFDFKVVVEGVETDQQVELISQLKVDCIQGYYFYKPMPAYAFASLPHVSKTKYPEQENTANIR